MDIRIAGAVSPEEIKFGPIIYKGRLDQSIAKLARFGYDGVEISLRDPDAIDVKSLREILDREGIELASLATGPGALMDGLTFTDTDRLVREKALMRMEKHIDLASVFSAQIIIGGMKGNLPGEGREKEAEGWAVEAFQQAADHARGKPVTILLEVINRYEMNWLNTVADGMDFIRRINRNNVALHIDTFHMNIEEPSITESIESAAGLIGYVHFADSNRWAPGSGHIDFENILSSLERVGYNGYISLEILPLPDPDSAAMKGMETIRSLL
jgi:sugar phosphate isomerase/epimerase